MAPITPAFAEEYWAILHGSELENRSIFNELWPEIDDREALCPQQQRNKPAPFKSMENYALWHPFRRNRHGNFYGQLDDKPAAHEQEDKERKERKWILDEILRSKEGRAWFEKMKGKIDIDKGDCRSRRANCKSGFLRDRLFA